MKIECCFGDSLNLSANMVEVDVEISVDHVLCSMYTDNHLLHFSVTMYIENSCWLSVELFLYIL